MHVAHITVIAVARGMISGIIAHHDEMMDRGSEPEKTGIHG
jgi:hypothetical protein